MSFDDQFSGLLICTAVVYRRVMGADGGDLKDPFNQPVSAGTTNVEHHREPCRINTQSGGEVMAERSRDVVQANTKLYVDRDGDIKEKDVVTVLGPSGEVLVDKGEVTLVAPVLDGVQLHHWECRIATQRESTGEPIDAG